MLCVFQAADSELLQVLWWVLWQLLIEGDPEKDPRISPEELQVCPQMAALEHSQTTDYVHFSPECL